MEGIFLTLVERILPMNIIYRYLYIASLLLGLGCSMELAAQAAPERISNELIIQLTGGQSPEIQDGEAELLSSSLNVYRVRFNLEKEAQKYFNEIQVKEFTRAVHFNHKIEMRDTFPNDPSADLQYAFKDILTGDFNDVEASSAWEITTGGVSALGDTIVIAVIDDGVQIDHIDLKDNMYVNREEIASTGLDNDGNGYIDDAFGWNVRDDNGEVITAVHGTAVAGIIGAKGNNNLLITGANWHVKILPVTMGEEATVAEVIKAYQYVLDQRRLYNETNGERGAYIVASNNSFGLEGFTYDSAPYWCDFFDTLGQEGIMTIAAGPNRTFDIDEEGDLPTVSPSPNLLTVAALNFESAWVNSGISSEHIDVAAYGSDLLSLGTQNSTSFISRSTSGAAAIVSGLVGLMYSVPCPDFTGSIHDSLPGVADIIRSGIESGVEKNSFLANKTSTSGIVNYFETLRPLIEPCRQCLDPDSVRFDQIAADSILITLSLRSDSVLWLQRSRGTRIWDTLQVPQIDTFLLPMGIGCQETEFAFIPICDSIRGLRSQSYDLEALVDCSMCEIEYCSPPRFEASSYWIEKISFMNNAFYSSNDLGYGSYTGELFTTFETDKEQFIIASYEKINPSDTLSFAVWLDIDHSGTFDRREKIGTMISSNPGSDRISLSIPFTAAGGLTTMRLGMIPNSQEVQRLQPCTAEPLQAYYEDYCVNVIVNDPLCPTVDSVEVLESEGNILSIAYYPELMPTEEGINVRFRKAGEEEWRQNTHNGNTFLMEGLEVPCVLYELEIRRVCDFDTSDYVRFEVESFCPTSAPIAEDQQIKIYPNPFQNQLYAQHDDRLSGRVSIRLYNQGGQLVMERKEFIWQQGQPLIPADAGERLPTGSYILQLIHPDGVYQQQVIKFQD
jgi:hypothetical protein